MFHSLAPILTPLHPRQNCAGLVETNQAKLGLVETNQAQPRVCVYVCVAQCSSVCVCVCIRKQQVEFNKNTIYIYMCVWLKVFGSLPRPSGCSALAHFHQGMCVSAWLKVFGSILHPSGCSVLARFHQRSMQHTSMHVYMFFVFLYFFTHGLEGRHDTIPGLAHWSASSKYGAWPEMHSAFRMALGPGLQNSAATGA